MTAMPGKYLHQLIRIKEHTTRIRVLRHSRLSNLANQETLTLCTQKIFHRRMIPTKKQIRHYQITDTVLNYWEILIVRANNLLLRESTNGAVMPRTSGLSGPSHANGQDRKPARKTMISAPLSLKIGMIDNLSPLQVLIFFYKDEFLLSNTFWYQFNKLN